MNLRLLFTFLGAFFLNPLQAEIIVRFEGRNEQEKQEINQWLESKKQCPKSIIAAVGLTLINATMNEKQLAHFKEGMDIKIVRPEKDYCSDNILVIDDAYGSFKVRDNNTYVIRLKEFARPHERLLKNLANPTKAAITRFCVEEVSINH